MPAGSRLLAAAALALACLAACTPRTTADLDPAAAGPPAPAGRPTGWRLAFADEFDGAALDRSRWADTSSAEPDGGRGNLDNQQLEWNQAANCRVGGGERSEEHTSELQ